MLVTENVAVLLLSCMLCATISVSVYAGHRIALDKTGLPLLHSISPMDFELCLPLPPLNPAATEWRTKIRFKALLNISQ